MSSGNTSSRLKLIVAIDGPSGAGKSSVTKALADRIGYTYIDTGAMFRTVALLVSRQGIDPADDRALQSRVEPAAEGRRPRRARGRMPPPTGLTNRRYSCVM